MEYDDHHERRCSGVGVTGTHSRDSQHRSEPSEATSELRLEERVGLTAGAGEWRVFQGYLN